MEPASRQVRVSKRRRADTHGGATFSGESVDKFNELLKQLPEAKAELEAKIAKAQKEEALFK
jgi:hypothetical protein